MTKDTGRQTALMHQLKIRVLESFFIAESCLVVDSTNSRIIDSRAINHIYMSSQVLQEGRILVEGQFKITFGTRARVSTILVYFYFNTGRCLILIDYYYVSRMKRNLIYISIKEPVIQYALSLYARQNVNISVLTAFFHVLKLLCCRLTSLFVFAISSSLSLLFLLLGF